ncbi:guanylyl cyclase [Obelidium mucronatum]|nr:guanylyl cyclase [Obelidium mucronatum]
MRHTELLETQLQSEEMRADTAVSQNLLGMMLPAHIMEKLEMGVQPEPEQFNCVTLFFTDINDFKKLVGHISPVKILQLLNVLYTKFDDIIAKYSQLYKVESVSDTYMVAAGLSSTKESTADDATECTIQALKCCIELQALVDGMDFSEIVGSHSIKLRIGIHSGTINAGLIGTKMSRYCLFGDTVNTASRMCTTGEPSKIQVSPQTIQVLGEDDQFEFEVRGEIEVKGKGRMTTYWLLS